jgi:hypothetical protein
VGVAADLRRSVEETEVAGEAECSKDAASSGADLYFECFF